jgi:hypothetical protein
MMRRCGYTLIELVLVLFLLILVAIGVFTLAASGSQAFLRLSDRQSLNADLRTGLSYLDVQVRKHDSQQSLSIQPDPFDAGPALVVEQSIEDKAFLTWIYVHDGYLSELFVEAGAAVTPDMASRIVRMDEMRLEQVAADAMRITLIRRPEGENPLEASRLIYLRAGGTGP